jgi:Fuc2NAc and GlcNAc transferase
LGFVVPVLGFVGIVASAGVVAAQAFFAAAALLALVSLWDDYREVRPALRFVCQAVAVAITLWGLQLPWHWLLIGIVALGMLWHVNLFNFMDGIDGIAGVQCIVYCVGAQLLTLGVPGWTGDLMWLLMGTVLAFLVYNWPPAKIFMGDVGSAFLGLLLALVVVELWQTERLPLVASLILLAGFWFDATYTLCVRMVTGQAFTQAHRSHLYQQIADRKGHLWTTAAFLLLGTCWLIPLAWLAMRFPALEYLTLGVAVAPLAILAVRFQAGVRANLMQEDQFE